MKKTFICILPYFLLFPTIIKAQEEQRIPIDPKVRTGKLSNGLTYYIRNNSTPKASADFYIVQKVGSILEEENQQGLAHFLTYVF